MLGVLICIKKFKTLFLSYARLEFFFSFSIQIIRFYEFWIVLNNARLGLFDSEDYWRLEFPWIPSTFFVEINASNY